MPDDKIYRTILLVLVVSLLIGAALALAGELLWHNPALSQAGTWLVFASGAAYAFFRVLGIREMRKRARAVEARGRRESGLGDHGLGDHGPGDHGPGDRGGGAP
jgi:uncharacterized membrane protein YecN with MAPEG domain